MNKNFKIDFGSSFNIWKNTIQTNLEINNIQNAKSITNLILESLKQKCCEYFTIYGFPEYQIRHNKQSVLEYFEKFGLKINITSNNTLWLILSYFTDIKDYTNCFDINICVKNVKIVNEKVIYIPYDNIIYAILCENSNINIPYIRGIKDALDYYIRNNLKNKNK